MVETSCVGSVLAVRSRLKSETLSTLAQILSLCSSEHREPLRFENSEEQRPFSSALLQNATADDIRIASPKNNDIHRLKDPHNAVSIDFNPGYELAGELQPDEEVNRAGHNRLESETSKIDNKACGGPFHIGNLDMHFQQEEYNTLAIEDFIGCDITSSHAEIDDSILHELNNILQGDVSQSSATFVGMENINRVQEETAPGVNSEQVNHVVSIPTEAAIIDENHCKRVFENSKVDMHDNSKSSGVSDSQRNRELPVHEDLKAGLVENCADLKAQKKLEHDSPTCLNVSCGTTDSHPTQVTNKTSKASSPVSLVFDAEIEDGEISEYGECYNQPSESSLSDEGTVEKEMLDNWSKKDIVSLSHSGVEISPFKGSSQLNYNEGKFKTTHEFVGSKEQKIDASAFLMHQQKKSHNAESKARNLVSSQKSTESSASVPGLTVDQTEISKNKEDKSQSTKKRTPMTAERKAKKKLAKKRKRAEKNRKEGVKRLKLEPFSKTVVVKHCKYYFHGRCQHGDKCKFSHDITPLTKSQPCKHFARNSCLKGNDCPFDHELSKYPCHNYMSKGTCSRGDTCHFSHVVAVADGASEVPTKRSESLLALAKADLQKRLTNASKSTIYNLFEDVESARLPMKKLSMPHNPITADRNKDSCLDKRSILPLVHSPPKGITILLPKNSLDGNMKNSTEEDIPCGILGERATVGHDDSCSSLCSSFRSTAGGPQRETHSERKVNTGTKDGCVQSASLSSPGWPMDRPMSASQILDEFLFSGS